MKVPLRKRNKEEAAGLAASSLPLPLSSLSLSPFRCLSTLACPYPRLDIHPCPARVHIGENGGQGVRDPSVFVDVGCFYWVKGVEGYKALCIRYLVILLGLFINPCPLSSLA